MKRPDDLLEKVVLAVLLFAAGKIALEATERAWTAVTDGPAPPDQSDRAVALADELIWVALSGLAVGFIRVFVRRGIPKLTPGKGRLVKKA